MKLNKYDAGSFGFLASFVVVFILIFLVLFYVFDEDLYSMNTDSFECQSVYKLETPELSMPTVASIKISGDKGFMNFGGPVYKNSAFVGAISRRVEFDFKDVESTFLFRINKTIRFEKDNLPDEMAEVILPGFFTIPESTIYFKTKKVKKGIFFYRDSSPMFYCQYF